MRMSPTKQDKVFNLCYVALFLEVAIASLTDKTDDSHVECFARGGRAGKGLR
jgi:hypothetical protein